MALLRRLEETFPPLETGDGTTKVGIGVATGLDHVFITKDSNLVEPSRLLPLALAKDTLSGQMKWSGHYLIDPWDSDGLVDLERYPRLRAYFQQHAELVQRRNTAKKNPHGWYRTIDRVTHALTKKPKLYIPDIKDDFNPVLDRGETYPHHNLYFVSSEAWDLEVLGGILLSAVGQFFIGVMESGCAADISASKPNTFAVSVCQTQARSRGSSAIVSRRLSGRETGHLPPRCPSRRTKSSHPRWRPCLDIEKRLHEAVQSYWTARSKNLEKQKQSGKIDAGTRGEVTGGTQMGALEVLIADILCDAGLKKLDVRTRTALELLDMCCSCRQVVAMSKMIQLRHVPDELHRKLKARAALAGLSLSDYLLEEVRRVAERPTVAELRNRLASRTPVLPRLSPVKAVRAERDSR